MTKYLADYSSRPINIVGGEGCYLSGPDGKKYLDFLAGWCVNNVGHRHPRVIQALRQAVQGAVYVPPVFRYDGWESFAELLVKNAPGTKLARAFRCTSGSEAVEFAIKCARAATNKDKIVSIKHVYHGHTYGAASVGNACEGGMRPCVPEFIKLPMPGRDASSAEVLAELESIFKRGDVAAFLSEPVWSNAGVNIPPGEFYPALQELCRKHKVLLIMDEVATGFGRCGKLFASELWALEPDILCLGKGLTGGYGTMGATLVSEAIYDKVDYIPHYSTFGWNPFDLAAADANVRVILEENLSENAGKIGSRLLDKLKELERFSFAAPARGVGLLLGVPVVTDKLTNTPDAGTADKIAEKCADSGLLIETAGNVLFITPPLILTEELADEGFAILEKVLAEI